MRRYGLVTASDESGDVGDHERASDQPQSSSYQVPAPHSPLVTKATSARGRPACSAPARTRSGSADAASASPFPRPARPFIGSACHLLIASSVRAARAPPATAPPAHAARERSSPPLSPRVSNTKRYLSLACALIAARKNRTRARGRSQTALAPLSVISSRTRVHGRSAYSGLPRCTPPSAAARARTCPIVISSNLTATLPLPQRRSPAAIVRRHG